jgi:hypothetical protein
VILWSSQRLARIGALKGRWGGRLAALAALDGGRQLVAAGAARETTESQSAMLDIWHLEKLHRMVVDAGLPDWTAPER